VNKVDHSQRLETGEGGNLQTSVLRSKLGGGGHYRQVDDRSLPRVRGGRVCLNHHHCGSLLQKGKRDSNSVGAAIEGCGVGGG